MDAEIIRTLWFTKIVQARVRRGAATPYVKGHYRKEHWVHPHYRRVPGLGVGATLALILVLLIIVKLHGA